jgi:UrcA family protein
MNSIANKTQSTLFAAGAAVISLASIFATASAFVVPPATVKIRDLNVNTPMGVIALSQRLHAAAQRVCFVDSNLGADEDTMRRAKNCANEAEARAVTHVNVAALTAYYQMNADRPAATLIASLQK